MLSMAPPSVVKLSGRVRAGSNGVARLLGEGRVQVATHPSGERILVVSFAVLGSSACGAVQPEAASVTSARMAKDVDVVCMGLLDLHG